MHRLPVSEYDLVVGEFSGEKHATGLWLGRRIVIIHMEHGVHHSSWDLPD